MNESPKIRTKLIALFGVNAYSNGLLNRSYIAQLVFKDKNKLDALNQIIHPEIAYVHLSLDKSLSAWKKGIQKHKLKGDHYFMQSGWKGPMGTFLDLDWIPRYMIVDASGKIVVYKAIKTKDKILRKHLK